MRFCTNCGAGMDDGLEPQAPKGAMPAAGGFSATGGSPVQTQTSQPKAISEAQAQMQGSASLGSAHSGAAAFREDQPTSRSISPVLLWGGMVLLATAVVVIAIMIFHPSPLRSQPSDAEIEKALQARFAADPNLSKYTLEVRSQSGVVTLLGLVNTDADKSAAASTAAQQEGVKKVNIYGLVIKGSGISTQGTSEGAGAGGAPSPLWLGFANETSAQDRDAELRGRCGNFGRVFVPGDIGNKFTDLCSHVGRTCERVCDWQGHSFSCAVVSLGGMRDGTRIALCR